MERALDPSLLGLALGDHDLLPSPEELAEKLADAELGLLIHKPDYSEDLEILAWYLHAVASSKYAAKHFGFERQRAAFKVSSHIFDLLLLSKELSSHERLKTTFAAQIAALRGDMDPNAIAIYLREVRPLLGRLDLLDDRADVSLTLAVALLGLDVKYVYDATDGIKVQATALSTQWEVDDITRTPFAPPAIVARSVRDLMSFLVYGSEKALPRALERLKLLVADRDFNHDRISQWVAAHLLNLASDLESSSIWKLMPPSVPPAVPRAFAMGYPRIVTLWPPQIEFIKPESPTSPSPFNPDIRRLFLSTPTSSGKTLIAQLLIASHVSTTSSAVCYIAPTRTLCREVARSIDQRVRYLGASSSHNFPEGATLEEETPQSHSIEIMTPERLSYLLRADPHAVLQRFGMFVFDEVHTVGDKSRGWTLEQEISFLHSATINTSHRIAILSAVIGNKGHFIEWLTPEGAPVFHRHSPWRGPRRISAIWSTHADWSASERTPTRSAKYPERVVCPLYGRLDARLGATGKTRSIRTTSSIGELTLRISPSGERSRDSNRTTPFYKMLAPLIFQLGRAGPVLVIESTRRRTVALASHLARAQEAPDRIPRGLSVLSDIVRARMGAEHPLSGLITRGVAYHHGGLSPDVRAAIEDAVNGGHLKILVATTTMTEGVNLPVRSVVVASQGAYGPGGYNEYITGPRLINAIGRAGRATKETEGIVVLARQAQTSPADFEKLSPSDAENIIRSTLTTHDALDKLAEFEEAQRLAEDAVLSFVAPPVSDFIAYIWFVASALERIGSLIGEDAIIQAVRATLGWRQLPDQDRDRWVNLALSTLSTYRDTSKKSRLRWPIAGTSIGSARTIEELAKDAAASLSAFHPLTTPVEFILAILNEARLTTILSLPEAPKLQLYNRRGTPRETLTIDMQSLIADWLSGLELVQIAKCHLPDVHPPDFQYEQLSDFTNHLLEVYLPWILGALTSWINEFLEEAGSLVRLPKSLPAYIRWGVGNEAALSLMVSGLYSRTLATRSSEAWIESGMPGDIIEWLRPMSLGDWREEFSASISDLRQLLELVRLKPEGLAYSLISLGRASTSVRSILREVPPTPVNLEQEDPQEISTIRILSAGNVMGEILSKDHSDMQSILSSGLPITASFQATAEGATVHLELSTFE